MKKVLSYHLKTSIAVLLLYFLFCSTTFSQNNCFYFKIKQSSGVTLPDYDTTYVGTYPYFQNLIDSFKVKQIIKPYSNLISTPFFQKVYHIEIDDNEKDAFSDSLLNYSFIEFVEYLPEIKYEGFTNDSMLYGENDWFLKQSDLYKAWDIQKGDTNVAIAIIDDAFKLNHPDLKDNLYYNRNEIPNNGIDDDGNGYIDDVNGWDVADSDNDANIDNKLTQYNYLTVHGTGCAAMCSGTPNNGKGGAGSGYNTRFIPIKTKQAKDSANPFAKPVSYILWQGVIYAANTNASIINCSWGGVDSAGGSVVNDSIIQFVKGKGKMFITSAGNNNNIYDTTQLKNPKFYPCNYSGVYCVGALDQFSSKAGFSNYKDISEIDIMAPGINMIGAANFNTNDYAYFGGTSAAGPYIAGIAALVKAQNPSYTSAQIENVLSNTAHSIDFVNPSYRTKLGVGEVDARAALMNKKLKLIEYAAVNRTAYVNDTVTLKIDSIAIPNANYILDWGDGIIQSFTTGFTKIKTYAVAGNYKLRLLVINTITNDTISDISKYRYISILDLKYTVLKSNSNVFIGNAMEGNFDKGKLNYKTVNNPTWGYTGFAKHANYSDYTGKYKYGVGYLSKYDIFSFDSLYNYDVSKPLRKCSIPDADLKISSGIISIPDVASGGATFLLQNSVMYGSNPGSEGFYYSIADSFGVFSKKFAVQGYTGCDADTFNNAIIMSESIDAVKFNKEGDYLIIGFDNPVNNALNDDLLIFKYQQSNPDSTKILFHKQINIPKRVLPRRYVKFSKGGNFIFVFDYANTYIYQFDKINITVTLYDSVIPYAYGLKASETNSTDDFLYYIGSLKNVEKSGSCANLIQYNLHTKARKDVGFIPGNTMNDMQLFADNRIYINPGYTDRLHIINNPDLECTSNGSNECGYTQNAFIIKPSDNTNYYTRNSIPELILDSNELYMDTFRIVDDCDSFYFQTVAYGPHKWNYINKVIYAKEYRFPISIIDTFNDKVSLTIRGKIVKKSFSLKAFTQNGLQLDYLDINGKLTLYADSSIYANFSDYEWYKDGLPVPGSCHCRYLNITEPGNYQVYGINSCNKHFVSNYVKIKPSCTKNFNNMYYANGHTFNPLYTGISATPMDSVYTMGNTIVIPAGAYVNIQNVKINMLPCAQIIVQQGGFLRFDNVEISSCQRWKGIKVNGNPSTGINRYIGSPTHGSLEMTNNTIRDAEVAIFCNEGGMIKITNNTFEENLMNLRISGYNKKDSIAAQISDNITRSRDFLDTLFYALCPQSFYPTGLNSYPEYYFTETAHLSISDCDLDFNFQYPSNYNGKVEGIYATGNKDIKIAGISSFNSSFYNKLINITNNDTTFIQGISVSNIHMPKTNFKITGNTAIFAKNNRKLEIHENDIVQCGRGVELYDSIPDSNAYNRISNTTFVDCQYGIVYSPYKFPINAASGSNQSDSTGSLQIECNKFVRNEIGIVGSGKVVNYSDTQNIYHHPRDNMNEFWNNKNWDAAWYEPNFKKVIWNLGLEPEDLSIKYPKTYEGNYINFWFFKPPPFLSDTMRRRTTLLYNDVNINGNTFKLSFDTDTFYMVYRAGDSVGYCRTYSNYRSGGDVTQTETIKDKSAVQIYPNPSTGKVYIESAEENQLLNMNLYDINGKLLFNAVPKEQTAKMEIDISSYPVGMYLIKIQTLDNQTHVSKLIKE